VRKRRSRSRSPSYEEYRNKRLVVSLHKCLMSMYLNSKDKIICFIFKVLLNSEIRLKKYVNLIS